jgi:hypothetical protein
MLGLHKEIQNNVRGSLRSQEIRWLSAVGFVPAPNQGETTGSVTRARYISESNWIGASAGGAGVATRYYLQAESRRPAGRFA